MEPVIVSEDKCLNCLYGVTGTCEMYDEIAKPFDGEKCYNFEQADDEEKAEGKKLAEFPFKADGLRWHSMKEQPEEFHTLILIHRIIKQNVVTYCIVRKQFGKLYEITQDIEIDSSVIEPIKWIDIQDIVNQNK